MSATLNLTGSGRVWTTTPELRIGSGPPYSNPALDVNLFFRVVLGLMSIFISFVPARLLWWNGEFAATVFCLNTVVSNSIYVVNALLWRDDNVKTWWAGYGWCDGQVYIVFALQTSYNICLFENIRGLATKIAIQRIGGLTPKEKRREHLISASIIFTIPVLQVILTYFIIRARYNVSTLAGCTPVYDGNWVFLVFFVIPSPMFTVGTAVMAVLAFRRFRQIDKMGSEVMHFRDDAQLARQQRVRRKVYFLTINILIVAVPIVCFFFVANIRDGWPWMLPFDLNRIHFGQAPDNIWSITFTTSGEMNFGDLTINYVSILSAIVVFITFGTTTEAYKEYRKALLLFGLGAIFPKLRDEYKSKPALRKKSWWSSFADSVLSRARNASKTNGSRKGFLLATTENFSFFIQNANSAPSQPGFSSQSTSTAAGQPPLLSQPLPGPCPTYHNPWPNLSAEDLEHNAPSHQNSPHHHTPRNPWMPFRLSPPIPDNTTATTPTRLPTISSLLPIYSRKSRGKRPEPGGKRPVFQVAPSVTSEEADISVVTQIRQSEEVIPWWEVLPPPPPCSSSSSQGFIITAPLPPPPPSRLPPRVDTRVWSEPAHTTKENAKTADTITTERLPPASSSAVPVVISTSATAASNSGPGPGREPAEESYQKELVQCPRMWKMETARGHQEESRGSRRHNRACGS